MGDAEGRGAGQPDPSRRVDWDPIAEGSAPAIAEAHTRLRRQCPVPYSDRWGGFWTLTRYADIEAAARDTDTFVSSKGYSVPYLDAGLRQIPLQSDPPEHFTYRSIIQPMFARGRIRAMEPAIRQLAVDLIDEMIAEGAVDVGPKLTLPLPASVLCMFLNLPRSDWPHLGEWTTGFVVSASAGDAEGASRAANAILDYTRGILEERQRQPLDPDTDFMSALLEARIDDRALTEEEILGYFMVMLKAGHETTTNGIGNAIALLAADEAMQDRLRAEPGEIPAAIEEFLRFRSPVQGLARTTVKETTIGGAHLPEGAKVVLLFASGNRDEEKFPDPDACLIDRTPNRHIAFGSGVHRCIGADLARLEIRVVLEELLGRTTRFALDGEPGPPMWPNLGMHSLPLRLEA